MSKPKRGSCLCGSVTYSVDGPLRAVSACHCQQCRKQSGHYYAATDSADRDLTIEDNGTLTWYAASGTAKRGFCSKCGSTLFWKHNDLAMTSILAGSFDDDPGVKLERHIFVANKGAYYEIDDNAPQFAQSDRNGSPD